MTGYGIRVLAPAGAFAALLLAAAVSCAQPANPDSDEKEIEAQAVSLFRQLVTGDASPLLRALDPSTIRTETFSRLRDRGVAVTDDEPTRALFRQALEGVAKGIAADLREMRFEITGRRVADGRAEVVAHGEKPPREHFFLVEWTRAGGDWKVTGFAQPISAVDVPELTLAMMVGYAARHREGEGSSWATRIEAGVGASALLFLLLWAAGRLVPARRRTARVGAVALWGVCLAGAFAASRALESTDTRLRRELLVMPETPVFLALRAAEFGPALEALERALVRRPGDPHLLGWQAFLFGALGKGDVSREVWTALLSHPPARTAAHYALVHHALREQDMATAAEHLAPACAALLDDPYVKAKLLWIEARLGKMDHLDREFLKCLARAYSDVPILLLRAKSYATLGMLNRAVADLQLLAGQGHLYREMVEDDQDLRALRDDPRIEALLPTLPSFGK